MTTAASSNSLSTYIVPFVDAVRAVFSTMVGLPVTIQAPHLKVDPLPSYNISGIIGFSGDVVGSVVLSFPTTVGVKIVEGFAGSALEPTTPAFADAIGELANMVAGAAKKDLGVQASISTPTVICGAGHLVARLSDMPCIVIPCHTSAGDFAIEVNIKISSK